ncbi:MAG: alpha/beta hydrolase, partial [Rhodanobacter sp.]
MKSGKRMGVVVAIAVAIFSANRVAHQREQDRPQVAAPTSTVAVAKAPAATWTLGSLTLTACSLGQPNSGLSTAAWCADFSVPENRADPHSRTIQLKLAVLRARAQVAKSDMLVFLAGGPGQAATESAGSVAAVMNQLLAHRHLLLLDQRGTGGSNALRCKESDDPATADDDASFDADKLRDAAAACLKQLQTHADPRYYTTTIAAQDLEDVRKALGSPALDLVGVSYGTRMAQQYLMRFPNAVRS